jgi:uncharacterized glyoxalase superfamily protein PhnB
MEIAKRPFKFYADALNGAVDAMMSHEGTPAPAHVPADWRNKILHAGMTVGSTVLMGSDVPPDRYQKPQRVLRIATSSHTGGSGARVSGAFKSRNRAHAHAANVLCYPLRNAAGSVRHSVDD